MLQESLSPLDSISDTLKSILELHFDRFTTGFMKNFIKYWGENPDDSPNSKSKGKKDAVEFLYKAINFERPQFRKFLKEEFVDNPAEEYKDLNVLSMQCSGDIENDDPVYTGCRRLSSLPEGNLKLQIAQYFKDQSNSFLQEKYPHLYSEIARENSQSSERLRL